MRHGGNFITPLPGSPGSGGPYGPRHGRFPRKESKLKREQPWKQAGVCSGVLKVDFCPIESNGIQLE